MNNKKNIPWDTMVKYLRLQDNCAVFGQGFRVQNLYKSLDKLEAMVNLHKPEDRAKNLYCKSLKGSLERIYNAHINGNIDPVDTVIERPFATKNDY